MKNLSSYTVIGLILLSSLPAFSADGDAPAAASGVLGSSSEGEKTASPQGGASYPKDDVPNTVGQWSAPVDADVGPRQCNIDVKSDIEIIKTAAKKYQEKQQECRDREDKANTYCLESRNPDLKNFISIAQVLTAGLSGMMDACSKFGKAMDLGNKAITAYQTLCSSWRGYCNAACGEAVGAVEKIKKQKDILIKNVEVKANAEAAAATARKDTATATACKNLAANYGKQVNANTEAIDRELKIDKNDYRAVAQKLETCKGYGKELATAALGGLAMLKSMATANKCEDDTKSSTAAATPTPVDCTIAANKQNNMTCICQDAPRTPGCNNGLDSATVAKNGDALRAASSGSYTPGTTGSNTGIDGGTGDGTDLSSKSPDGGGGGSLPGAPSGGGGGLGGSGGGFGGGAGGAEAKKASGLNANILGGEGGGGGGGSWGGYGYDKDPALRQYLPGGAKDPAAMAGAAVSKQVTSQGGKSNWEKVKERYRDNKPSLLGY